jgi:hypothetical protein
VETGIIHQLPSGGYVAETRPLSEAMRRRARIGAAVSSGEEDDMSDTTPALDEAFERMAAASALALAAVRSLDPHQVKLVEACRRGLVANGDPAFAAAAETVTGLR